MRTQPGLLERMEVLAALTQVASAQALPTADEVEEQVAEPVRHLGREVIRGWARAAESQVAAAVRRRHPQARLREKKACAGTPPLAK